MTGYQWTRPRQIGITADILAKAKAYEAHSLPGEPYDAEPQPDLRDRVYALSHLVPQIPACEADEDGPDIACPTCEDTGEIGVGEWNLQIPCPDCPAYDWRQELFDDMERGK